MYVSRFSSAAADKTVTVTMFSFLLGSFSRGDSPDPEPKTVQGQHQYQR